MVSVAFSKRDLARAQRRLRDVPRGLPRVMCRAINDTATSARHHAAKAIQADAPMQLGYIKREILIDRAGYQRWVATLSLSRKRIPLSRFSARPVRGGVSYRVRASEGRSRIPGAFLQRTQTGHLGVWKIRKTPGPRGGRWQQLYGPSLGHVFTNAGRIVEQQIERLTRRP